MTTTAEYQHLIYRSLFDLADDYYSEADTGNTGAERVWFLDQSVTLHQLALLVSSGECNILTGQAYVEAGRSLLGRIQTTRLARGKSKSSMDHASATEPPSTGRR